LIDFKFSFSIRIIVYAWSCFDACKSPREGKDNLWLTWRESIGNLGCRWGVSGGAEIALYMCERKSSDNGGWLSA